MCVNGSIGAFTACQFPLGGKTILTKEKTMMSKNFLRAFLIIIMLLSSFIETDCVGESEKCVPETELDAIDAKGTGVDGLKEWCRENLDKSHLVDGVSYCDSNYLCTTEEET